MVTRPVAKHSMLIEGTPYEVRKVWTTNSKARYQVIVKREDLACPPPGPPFSKTRGVYAHVAALQGVGEVGVLDTAHSQAGHAVARACQLLGLKCTNFYPDFKKVPGPKQPQLEAQALGAELYPLPAGRSAILYHQAKRIILERGGYMMPNALKLGESVSETAKEGLILLPNRPSEPRTIVVPISSGTIASGVLRAFGRGPTYYLHMGYSRSHDEVRRYVEQGSGITGADIRLVDEGYAYADKARPGLTPDWPCNEYYDLKAYRWMTEVIAEELEPPILFWNIG